MSRVASTPIAPDSTVQLAVNALRQPGDRQRDIVGAALVSRSLTGDVLFFLVANWATSRPSKVHKSKDAVWLPYFKILRNGKDHLQQPDSNFDAYERHNFVSKALHLCGCHMIWTTGYGFISYLKNSDAVDWHAQNVARLAAANRGADSYAQARIFSFSLPADLRRRMNTVTLERYSFPQIGRVLLNVETDDGVEPAIWYLTKAFCWVVEFDISWLESVEYTFLALNVCGVTMFPHRVVIARNKSHTIFPSFLDIPELNEEKRQWAIESFCKGLKRRLENTRSSDHEPPINCREEGRLMSDTRQGLPLPPRGRSISSDDGEGSGSQPETESELDDF